jgi:hypothetical protein
MESTVIYGINIFSNILPKFNKLLLTLKKKEKEKRKERERERER